MLRLLGALKLQDNAVKTTKACGRDFNTTCRCLRMHIFLVLNNTFTYMHSRQAGSFDTVSICFMRRRNIRRCSEHISVQKCHILYISLRLALRTLALCIHIILKSYKSYCKIKSTLTTVTI